MNTMNVPGYEQLADILTAAYNQAAVGKGAERHAGGQPFDQQPMQQISDLFDSPYGMAFQVCKKLHEGIKLDTLERQERELLGVINYTAGIILWLRRQSAAQSGQSQLDLTLSVDRENDDWIEWCGGQQPVPFNAVVEIKLRNGEIHSGSADLFRWTHYPASCVHDIIAYRVVKP